MLFIFAFLCKGLYSVRVTIFPSSMLMEYRTVCPFVRLFWICSMVCSVISTVTPSRADGNVLLMERAFEDGNTEPVCSAVDVPDSGCYTRTLAHKPRRRRGCQAAGPRTLCNDNLSIWKSMLSKLTNQQITNWTTTLL